MDFQKSVEIFVSEEAELPIKICERILDSIFKFIEFEN